MKNYIIFWVSTFWVFQRLHQQSAGFGLFIMGLGIRKHFAALRLLAGSLLCPIPARPGRGAGMMKWLQRHSHGAEAGHRARSWGSVLLCGEPRQGQDACTPCPHRALPTSTKGAACQDAALAPRALAGTGLGWLCGVAAGAIPRSVTAGVKRIIPVLRSSSRAQDPAMPLGQQSPPALLGCDQTTSFLSFTWALLHLPRPRLCHRLHHSPPALPAHLRWDGHADPEPVTQCLCQELVPCDRH